MRKKEAMGGNVVLPFEIIHMAWKRYLLNMMIEQIPTEYMKRMKNKLYNQYPNGSVANVGEGETPQKAKGLTIYRAKHIASPPISVKRILNYDGKKVTQWYNDHKTKARKEVTVDVPTFVGRMVWHIMPKGFQRIRYYGLQATKTFNKWSEVIRAGIKKLSRVIKGAYEVVASMNYRQRYIKGSGKDPLKCLFYKKEMGVWLIWHPKYGVIYDEERNIKMGRYERGRGVIAGGGGRPAVWISA